MRSTPQASRRPTGRAIGSRRTRGAVTRAAAPITDASATTTTTPSRAAASTCCSRKRWHAEQQTAPSQPYARSAPRHDPQPHRRGKPRPRPRWHRRIRRARPASPPHGRARHPTDRGARGSHDQYAQHHDDAARPAACDDDTGHEPARRESHDRAAPKGRDNGSHGHPVAIALARAARPGGSNRARAAGSVRRSAAHEQHATDARRNCGIRTSRDTPDYDGRGCLCADRL